MSFEKYSANRISSRIIDAIDALVEVRRSAEGLLEAATEEYDSDEDRQNALSQWLEVLDKAIVSSGNHVQAMSNSAVTLAKAVLGQEINEEGEMEIDVIPSGNGVKL